MEKPNWCLSAVYDFWMKGVPVVAQQDFDPTQVVRTPAEQLAYEEKYWLILAAFHHPDSEEVWNRMMHLGCLDKDIDALDFIISVRFRPAMPPTAERAQDFKLMKKSFKQLLPLLEKHEVWSWDRTRYIDTRHLTSLVGNVHGIGVT